MRTSNLSLKLSNEGLLEEVARWRQRAGDDPTAPLPVSTLAAAVPPSQGGEESALAAQPEQGKSDTQPLLEMFASYPPDAQRIALDAITRVHEALTGTPASGTAITTPSTVSAELPASLDPSARLSALEQLAETLSEDESAALILSLIHI